MISSRRKFLALTLKLKLLYKSLTCIIDETMNLVTPPEIVTLREIRYAGIRNIW